MSDSTPPASHADKSRIARNTFFLYLRTLISMSVSLYTSRIVLHALGVQDYGIYNVVGGFIAMFSLFNGSLSSCIQRYLTFELGKRNPERLSRLFAMSLNIHLIICIMIILAGESVGVWFLNCHMNFPPERLVSANWVYQLTLLAFVFGVMSVPYNAAIAAHERFNAYAYMSIVEVAFKLGIAFLVSFFPLNRLILYAALILVSSFVIRCIYILYCRRHFPECRYSTYWNWSLGRDMFSFSLWNFIGSGAQLLKVNGVNILLNMFFGVVVNTANAIAQQVTVAISSFVSGFTGAASPQITKLYAAGEYEKMNKLALQSAKFSFFLLLFFSLPVLFQTEFLLTLWLGQFPEYTVSFTRLVIICSLIDILSSPLITVMLATGKIAYYQCAVGGVILLNVPVAWLFLRLGFPPPTVAAVACLISVAAFTVRFPMLNRIIPFPFSEFRKMVLQKTGLVTCISICVTWAVRQSLPYGWTSFILTAAVSSLSSLGCMYWFGLTSSESEFLRKMIYGKITRLLP